MLQFVYRQETQNVSNWNGGSFRFMLNFDLMMVLHEKVRESLHSLRTIVVDLLMQDEPQSWGNQNIFFAEVIAVNNSPTQHVWAWRKSTEPLKALTGTFTSSGVTSVGLWSPLHTSWSSLRELSLPDVTHMISRQHFSHYTKSIINKIYCTYWAKCCYGYIRSVYLGWGVGGGGGAHINVSFEISGL